MLFIAAYLAGVFVSQLVQGPCIRDIAVRGLVMESEQDEGLIMLAEAIPRQLPGETIEDYNKFLVYAMMLPGERVAGKVAKRLGLSEQEVIQLAVKHHWVDRAREFDRQRLEELRLSSAARLQQTLQQLLLTVQQVSARIIAAASEMEIGPHNVAQMVEAFSRLFEVIARVTGGLEEPHQPSLHDVLNVINVIHTGSAGRPEVREVSGGDSSPVVVDVDSSLV